MSGRKGRGESTGSAERAAWTCGGLEVGDDVEAHLGDDRDDGVARDRDRHHPGAQCCADAARAVGAIGLGTEGIVRAMYQPLVEACQHYPGLTRQQAVFFELHCLVDDDHAEALRQIACDLCQTTAGRASLRLGMHQALGLRATFWEAMYRRALAMEAVQ
mgnify:CR=1 FL=1